MDRVDKIATTVLVFFGAVLLGSAYLFAQPSDPNPWDNAEIVSADLGGPLFPRYGHYVEKGLDKDYRLRIEGPCASACTFFLKPVPKENVCYGPLGKFGFHGVWVPTFGGTKYEPNVTQYMLDHIYPPEVSYWLTNQDWDPAEQVEDPQNLDMIWTSPATFGIQKCEEVIDG